MRNFLLVVLLMLAYNQSQASSDDAYAGAYIWAYPQVSGVRDGSLIFRDGSTIPLKIALETNNPLEYPNLDSQLKEAYPAGEWEAAMCDPDYKDPGRVRYDPFFKKIYGATENEVKKNLVEVMWMPRHINTPLKVTAINGVADKIMAISEELDILADKHPEMLKFLENPGGTFLWRKIAGTDRQSAHSYGMTIDINVKYSDYWLWDYKKEHNISPNAYIPENSIAAKDCPHYRNKIPMEIVKIFEKYHFIWGGKWCRHYDTMHFEYRPELFYKM